MRSIHSKCACDMIKTHIQLHHTDKYSQYSQFGRMVECSFTTYAVMVRFPLQLLKLFYLYSLISFLLYSCLVTISFLLTHSYLSYLCNFMANFWSGNRWKKIYCRATNFTDYNTTLGTSCLKKGHRYYQINKKVYNSKDR